MSDDNNFVSLVKILATPIQEAENAVWEVVDARNVNVAVGDALTLLGKLVGQARNGVTDDDLYRVYVRARILANRSNGNGEDIIAIFALLVGDSTASLWVRNTGVASFEIEVRRVATTFAQAAVYLYFLRSIVAAGVQAVMLTYPTDPSDVETFGDGGDIYTPSSGTAGMADASGSPPQPVFANYQE